MKFIKKITVVISFGWLVLIACTPSTLNHFDFKNETPFKTSYDPSLSNIEKNNVLFDNQGLEATDPTKCTNGDLCYFQYINDRSFSIFKSVKTKDNPSGGGWGTGWFIDREVGTNNFYIANKCSCSNFSW